MFVFCFGKRYLGQSGNGKKKLYKKPAAVDISAAVLVVQLLCTCARTAAAAAAYAVTNLTGAVYAKVYTRADHYEIDRLTD